MRSKGACLPVNGVSVFVQAALRRAIGELIFFAGVNDLQRCQKIVSAWGIKLDDNRCADYDRRTPLCVPGCLSASHVFYPLAVQFHGNANFIAALPGVAALSNTP